VPYWLIAALAVSIVVAALQRRWILLCGTLIAIAANFGPAIRSPTASPHYFMAMPLVVFTFCIITAGASARRFIFGRSVAVRRGIAFIVIAGALATMISDTIAKSAEARAESAFLYPRRQVESAILKMAQPGDTVLVPYYFIYGDLASASSSSAFRKMAADCEQAAQGGKCAAKFAKSYGFAPELTYVFADDFVQKERIFAARMRVMAGLHDEPGINLYFYNEPNDEGRLGRPDAAAAIDAFRSGQISILLLADQQIPDVPPTAVFGDVGTRYYLYARSSSGGS
jgi:hypothetical protein